MHINGSPSNIPPLLSASDPLREVGLCGFGYPGRLAVAENGEYMEPVEVFIFMM